MKMKRVLYILAALAFVAVLVGCGPVPAPLARDEAVMGTVVVERAVEVPVMVEREEVKRAPALAPAGAPQLEERMIIRTGELSLEVEETEKAMEEARALVQGIGGFVADSRMWRDRPLDEDTQPRGWMSVRVPAARFDEVVAGLKELALEVRQEVASGRDVTEEFVDLEARLKNLTAVEEELRELLAEVRAKTGKAEDIMSVYRELTRIREEVERLTGRMKFLEDQVAMATITVEFIPRERERPIVEPGWSPAKTVRDASRGLVRALETLVDWLIWLVIGVVPILTIVLAVLAVLAALAWLIIRGIVRAVRRRRESQ
jgi:hypothetical protein